MRELFMQKWKQIPQSMRKIFVFVAGWLIILIGMALLALPGPGWAVIFLGFAVLATEFTSARQVKDAFVKRVQLVIKWFKKRFLSKKR